MIQIDDAGSGSLIGGTGIGILNTENNQYYFEVIPLEFYQTQLFSQKAYQDYVIKIVKYGFRKLQVNKSHFIEVCQGYMFDKLRYWLDKNNYQWKSTKIEGPLQLKIEESFNQYVISLGLPKAFIKHARYAFGFHRLLKWVFADFENRKNLCKTKWKSWQKWGNIEKSIYFNNLEYPDYCLKCGGKIKPPLKVVTIEYITNKPATINLHNKCYQGKLNPFPPVFLHQVSLTSKIYSENLLKPNIKLEEKITLKEIQNNLVIFNTNGEKIGYLNCRLGEKIAFWMEKGFNWNCIIQDLSENKLQFFAQLN